jgi:hypothetical protein
MLGRSPHSQSKTHSYLRRVAFRECPPFSTGTFRVSGHFIQASGESPPFCAVTVFFFFCLRRLPGRYRAVQRASCAPHLPGSAAHESTEAPDRAFPVVMQAPAVFL